MRSITSSAQNTPLSSLTLLQENESVVHRVLVEFQPHWKLARALPQWTSRGLALFAGGECLRGYLVERYIYITWSLLRSTDQYCYLFLLSAAEKCIRAVPEKDLTNGFFVAVFERIT